MDIERQIMAWVTRVDMFIISAWKHILLAIVFYAISLLAWTISECVMKSQRGDPHDTEGRE